jgi:hypothetical protein
MVAFAHKSERFVGDQGKLVDPLTEVAALANARLGEFSDPKTSVSDSTLGLRRGSELCFVPDVVGVVFNPPRASFLWLEPIHVEEFRLRADPHMAGQYARGHLSVFFGLLLIADVSINISVSRVDDSIVADDTRNPPMTAMGSDSARRYRAIFASYSHLDADIVNWFEQTYRSIGDELLRDVRHLRSGEVWDDRLKSLIRESDLFQLFWSSNSRQSEFVRQEWGYALGLHRDRFIRPVYWQLPMPHAPDELGHVHFTFFDGPVAAAYASDPPGKPSDSPSRPRHARMGFESWLDELGKLVQAPTLHLGDQQFLVAALEVELALTAFPGTRSATPTARGAVLHFIQQMKLRNDLYPEIVLRLETMSAPRTRSSLLDGINRVPETNAVEAAQALPSLRAYARPSPLSNYATTRSRVDASATAAFVVGLLGIFAGAVVVNALAIWLSRRALHRIALSGGLGAGRAKAGFYLGVAGLVIWVAITVLAIAATIARR